MALDFTLRKMRKKAIIRIIIYGLFALSILTDPSVPFIMHAFVFYKLYKWVQNYIVTKEFPRFVQAMQGREKGRSRDIAKRLKISQQTLKSRVKRMKKLDLLPETIVEKDGDFSIQGAQAHPIKYWLRDEDDNVPDGAENNAPQNDQDDLTDTHPMKCPSCGAENLVSSKRTTKCPYCGRGLRYPG